MHYICVTLSPDLHNRVRDTNNKYSPFYFLPMERRKKFEETSEMSPFVIQRHKVHVNDTGMY